MRWFREESVLYSLNARPPIVLVEITMAQENPKDLNFY